MVVAVRCAAMDPEDCAAQTTAAVSGMASYFMLDASTYAVGAEQGYAGLDFYAAGRAGVLGDADPDQVADCFGFMEPTTVRGWLEQARAVAPPAQTAAAYLACGYAWADEHLGDDVDWARLADLAGRVNAAADGEGLPLFTAWRAAPEPDGRSDKVLALHRLHVLRELRNEIHVAAVRDAGLSPVQALALRSPAMAPMFGWSELPEVDDDVMARHEEAEAETNRRIATAYAALDESERAELVGLCEGALASVH